MSYYVLKNKELRKTLDYLTFGAFSEKLNTAVLDQMYNGETMLHQCKVDCTLLINPSDIVPSTEYNENRWNDWEDVTPPSGVWMQFEDENKEGYRVQWNGREWRDANNNIKQFSRGRFRPWD